MEKIFWITLHLCILLVCSSDIKPVMVEKTKTDFVGKEKRVLLENPAFNESPVLIEADKKEEDYPAWNENQPLSKQWRGGSAEKARTKVKQLDRFQEQMKEDKESYIKNQKKRRFALGPKKNDLAEPQRTDSNSMTKTMKANKPGTEEFKTRQKALDEVVNKVTKKKKEKKRNTNLEVAQNEDKNKIELLPYYKDARESKTLSLQRFKKLTPEESLISDISKTIHFSFANLFFRKADKLRPAELIAFRDFLNLLQVSLPPEWRLHRLIGDLRRNFVKVGKGRENLQDILKKYPQPNLAWSNDCKTGGFHCGFWKLLHTITVGIAEHRGGLNLIEVDLIEPNAKTFAPMEAADVIRSYIEHFYIDCDNCRKTFMELYSNCENNRRCDRLTDDKDGASIADWKELALWLWEVHNEISLKVIRRNNKMIRDMGVRIRKNTRRTGNEVQALWPDIQKCLLCFEDEGRWDEARVFQYLEKTYWPGSESDPKFDKLLKVEGENSTGMAFFLFVCMGVFLEFFYSLISRNSGIIHRSVLKARIIANIRKDESRKV